MFEALHLYFSGKQLPDVARAMADHGDMTKNSPKQADLGMHLPYQQAVLNLLGHSNHTVRLIGSAYDEDQAMAALTASDQRDAMGHVYLNRAILAYLFGHIDTAVDSVSRARAGLSGPLLTVIVNFYESLIMLTAHPSDDQRAGTLARVRANQEELTSPGESADMNVANKYFLVEAEYHRVQGDKARAMDCYEQALDLARQHRLLQDVALASELAARFYLAWGKETIARAYLVDAYHGYLRWGAVAKARQLEKDHRKSLSPMAVTTGAEVPGSLSIHSSDPDGPVDMISAMGALQVLARELVVDRVLTTSIRVALATTGAQRGALLLMRDGELTVEATGVIDTSQPERPGIDSRLQSIPAGESQDLPWSLIRHVAQSLHAQALDDAGQSSEFAADPYLARARPRSVLCLPLVPLEPVGHAAPVDHVGHAGQLPGVLYLEHELTAAPRTEERRRMARLVCAQIVISLQHARLCDALKRSETRAQRQVAQMELTTAQLARARDAAEASSRAKSQLMAGMSHELRTPLNAILGYSELLIEDSQDIQDPSEMVPDLESIHDSGKLLLKLVTNIVDLARIEAGQVEIHATEFDVATLIRDAIQTVQPHLDTRGNTAVIDLSQGIGKMAADRSRVMQCLESLLNNASRSTENGAITLAVRRVDGALMDLADRSLTGDFIAFAITHAGSDASQQDRAPALEPTSTSQDSPTRGGAGAGTELKIAKQLCVQMGGHTTVEIEAGQGATITMLLPEQPG